MGWRSVWGYDARRTPAHYGGNHRQAEGQGGAMMTTLAQLVWDCRAIGGMDKLVLMGWMEQVPDGSDIACASKETVASFIGIGIRTVQRHTKALVNRGCLIDTGERKQWKFGWTPVYQVNLELLIGQPVKLTGVSDCTPCLDGRQGSTGSLVLGLGVDLLCSSSPASGSDTGVPPVDLAPTTVGRTEDRTEDRKPVEPKPTPTPYAQRHCPKCNESWSRYSNHICLTVNSMVNPMDDWDEPLYPRVIE